MWCCFHPASSLCCHVNGFKLGAFQVLQRGRQSFFSHLLEFESLSKTVSIWSPRNCEHRDSWGPLFELKLQFNSTAESIDFLLSPGCHSEFFFPLNIQLVLWTTSKHYFLFGYLEVMVNQYKKNTVFWVTYICWNLFYSYIDYIFRINLVHAANT